ncbi:LysR family transcriptional regulator [Glutamicibacter sp.]|uniref:LysR family transcriptional regulator n=1 Tax=Glutamicibacter sp. TaxID=1931995 RepID=UPI0028BDF154|nr:LysR family transcriptional regulator [Glutamicibacter sp.]
MDITLTQLRYFSEAASRLSMTAAAERLNVAQSAVSSAVAQLEKQIGSQLFIRQRSKGLLLTQSGELFLKDANSVLAHLEEIVENARGDQTSLSGLVRLACFSTLAPFHIPDLVNRLKAEHPDLTLEVLEADAEGCAQALGEGRVDLALCYDLGLSENIATSSVRTSRPYLALPPSHRLAREKSVELQQLAADPFILLNMPHSRELMLSILTNAGIEPKIRFQSASYETVRTFVAHDHGYAILHQRPAHPYTYDGSSVAIVEIADKVPELQTVLAYLGSQRPTGRMRAVAAAVHAQVAEQSQMPMQH